MLPPTWTSLHDFQRDYEPGQFYILKKNIQNKKGVKICKSLKEVNTNFPHGYILIQKYIEPSLIAQRKTNLRVYLLITKDTNQELNFYIHDVILPSPTNKDYNRNSSDKEANITNIGVRGSNCSIYDKYPKDHKELGNIYGTELKSTIINTLKHLKQVCDQVLPPTDTFTYQLFGVDFLIASNDKPYLLEINYGPTMKAACPHQTKYNTKVLKDVQRTAGIVNDGETSQFNLI